jgi:hypothetical protein
MGNPFSGRTPADRRRRNRLGLNAPPAAMVGVGGSPEYHMISHVGAPVAKKLPAKVYWLEVPKVLMRPDERPMNPSIAIDEDGKLRAIIRVWSRARATTRNVVGELRDYALTAPQLLGDGDGAEDCRLLFWRGEPWVVAMASSTKRIMLMRLSADLTQVVARHHQPSPRIEKNHMPFVRGDELRLIYSVEPLIVMRYNHLTHMAAPSAMAIHTKPALVRGGSQIVSDGRGGWVGVVHDLYHWSAGSKGCAAYTHRFVRFEEDGRVSFGPHFYIDHLGIEFVAGLARVGSAWVLSFGIRDEHAAVAVIGEEAAKEWIP